MISGVVIKNYKSIGELGVELELKPLTILLGPNGSGKSSTMEALCILVQGIGNPIAWSAGDGTLVNYPSIQSIAHKNESDRWISIEIGVSPLELSPDEQRRLQEIWRDLATTYTLLDLRRPALPERIGYRYEYRIESEEYRQSILVQNRPLVTVGYMRTDRQTFQAKYLFPEPLADIPVRTANIILDPASFGAEQTLRHEFELLPEFAQFAVETIASQVRNRLFLLSPLRGSVPQEASADQGATWVGKQGEWLVQILALIYGGRDYIPIRSKVTNWAQEFGIADPSAGWRRAHVLGADYLDPELERTISLAMAGYGSRQIMSVVTQLFWMKPHDTLIVEEPEISLHPNSQAKLPELFANAIQDDKQVIITTHSEVIPLALRRPIAAKLLEPKDIAVYHVEKRQDGTHATELELTDDGYVSGWVPSFAETEKELFKEWAETIPKE